MTTKKEQAISLKEQGEPLNKIAEVLGVSERTVRRYLSEGNSSTEESLEPTESVNDKIDNRLRILAQRGLSTKYQCLGVIAEYTGIDLTDPAQKQRAEVLFANARKRLYRRKEEFHIVPSFIANSSNARDLLTHFYKEAEDLWYHLEQSIDSILESHYTQENKTRIRFQLRAEFAKALCLPNATNTAKEQANARMESFWRVAELKDNWEGGRHSDNTFSIDNTEEQLLLQQELVEQEIEETLGITKQDIPY